MPHSEDRVPVLTALLMAAVCCGASAAVEGMAMLTSTPGCPLPTCIKCRLPAADVCSTTTPVCWCMHMCINWHDTIVLGHAYVHQVTPASCRCLQHHKTSLLVHAYVLQVAQNIISLVHAHEHQVARHHFVGACRCASGGTTPFCWCMHMRIRWQNTILLVTHMCIRWHTTILHMCICAYVHQDGVSPVVTVARAGSSVQLLA